MKCITFGQLIVVILLLSIIPIFLPRYISEPTQVISGVLAAGAIAYFAAGFFIPCS